MRSCGHGGKSPLPAHVDSVNTTERGNGIFSSPLQRPTGAAGWSAMVGNGPTAGNIPGPPSGPFAPGAKRPFYFLIETVEQRLRLLKRLMAGRDALILVIGETGSGKTTLMKRLIDTVKIPCRQGRFRQPTENQTRPPVPTLLRTHPVFILKNMAQSTIILDDAHALGPEELAFLLRIISPPCGVRIANRMVLFGEPSLNSPIPAGLTSALYNLT